MKKKISLLLVAILAIFTLVSCGNSTPKDATKDYFDQVASDSSSKFSRESLKKDLGASSSTSKIPDDCVDAMIDCIGKMEVTVNDESVDGDKATVNIKVKGIDLMKAINESVTEAQKSTTSDTTQDELEKNYYDILTKKLKEQELSERDCKINLTKSDNEWKVNEDDADFGYAIWGIKQN